MSRVAVIGAGPAGLVVMKELRELGIDAVAFEATSNIGGVFSKCYSDALLTSSTNITAFGSFPHGDEERPRFWAVPEYADYLRRYMEHFHLTPHISLNTRVTSIERESASAAGGWLVTTTTTTTAAVAAATVAPTATTIVSCFPEESKVGTWNDDAASSVTTPIAARKQVDGGGGGGGMMNSNDDDGRVETAKAGRNKKPPKSTSALSPMITPSCTTTTPTTTTTTTIPTTTTTTTPVVTTTQRFDRVVVCSGIHSAGGVLPSWAMENKEFGGEIIHSSLFMDAATQCAGKRVLVVGVGESGSDIALLAAKVASATCVSIRSSPGYIVPRVVGGWPSDIDTNRMHYSVPREIVQGSYWQGFKKIKLWLESLYFKPQDDRPVLCKAGMYNRSCLASNNHPLTNFNRFGTKNTSFIEAERYHGSMIKPGVRCLDEKGAIFEDGTRFDCDLIICCTGFTKSFPFLDARQVPTLHADIHSSSGVRKLYKHMFHPDLGNSIAFVGFLRPGFGAIPPICEMQSRYLALIFAGTRKLPCPLTMRQVIAHDEKRDLAQYPHDGPRLTELADYFIYMEELAKEIDCQPPVYSLLLTDPLLAHKVLHASICGAQYRLRGPGCSYAQASATLKRMPTLGFPIIFTQAITIALLKLASTVGLLPYRMIGV